jgi:tRNA pseudouridine 55 synthase
MDGLLIIDKPAGWTSHDVVARARRILREKSVGHTGTLDPFATGVLVLLIGRATRLAQFLSGAVKEYEAVVRFGYATETGDLDGDVRPETVVPVASEEFAREWDGAKIEEAVNSLRGEIEQVPPMYSAKKVKGQKLYELARRGVEIERAAVKVLVHEMEAIETGGALVRHNADGTCDLSVRVVCSAGTYVRALAESLGENLGIAAHLASLRRTRAGEFQIKSASTLDELEEMTTSGVGPIGALLPMKAALSSMPSAHLTGEAARLARHGGRVRLTDSLKDGELVQMCDEAGELIGIAAFDGPQGVLRPRVVFALDE